VLKAVGDRGTDRNSLPPSYAYVSQTFQKRSTDEEIEAAALSQSGDKTR
jgi:hypothetical protein